MARIKRGVAARKRKKRFLKHAKGYRGRRKNTIRTAREAIEKGWNHAYRDRRARKREFRRLWIVRINAGARQNGMPYNRLMHGLKQAGVQLDRKTLADIAVNDPDGFAALVETAREAQTPTQDAPQAVPQAVQEESAVE